MTHQEELALRWFQDQLFAAQKDLAFERACLFSAHHILLGAVDIFARGCRSDPAEEKVMTDNKLQQLASLIDLADKELMRRQEDK